jgi:hypothetical protein
LSILIECPLPFVEEYLNLLNKELYRYYWGCRLSRNQKLWLGFCLITAKASFPAGFDFYIPNPKWKAWKKEDHRLKKQKIAKKHRPAEPQRHPNYPTKVKIALNLL